MYFEEGGAAGPAWVRAQAARGRPRTIPPCCHSPRRPVYCLDRQVLEYPEAARRV